MQKHELCFNDFPNECEGCTEYREKHHNSALPLVLMTGMGMAYPGQYKNVIVKECKLYHKRRVEIMK